MEATQFTTRSGGKEGEGHPRRDVGSILCLSQKINEKKGQQLGECVCVRGKGEGERVTLKDQHQIGGARGQLHSLRARN